MHDVRVTSGYVTEEELQADQVLRRQASALQTLRVSLEALDKLDDDLTRDRDASATEVATLRETIMQRLDILDELKRKINAVEERLEELQKLAEVSEHAQAMRLRRTLLQWDSPSGPQQIAAETFSHIDINHDGKLEWHNDEI